MKSRSYNKNKNVAWLTAVILKVKLKPYKSVYFKVQSWVTDLKLAYVILLITKCQGVVFFRLQIANDEHGKLKTS